MEDRIEWRRHQSEALEAIATAPGPAHWVVMPPGAGKTLVGVEAARRTGRPSVAFAPNIAITQQWSDAWRQLTGGQAGTSRDLTSEFTALTYQALAVFDADADGASPRNRLHANGEALIARLHELGPLTIILDECHHLLQVWGRLLDEVLSELDDAVVIALTATPPELLSKDEAELVQRLFGRITYSASIPAVVSAGDLAPFAELVWFTTPSTRELQWLDERALRYQEFITELTRVDIATPLLSWIALQSFDAMGEARADAVIRLALAGEVAMPDEAHGSERHRRRPDLADWIELVDAWLPVLEDSVDDDRQMAGRIVELLPLIGYRRTRHGLRPGTPLVDRVLSRSSSKALAAADIVASTITEHPEARLLILTDHATVSSLPADLDGVVEPEAGSARWVLATLLRDPQIAAARPLMVTGAMIAGAHDIISELAPPGTTIRDDDGVFVIEGWRPEQWVRAATDALAAGTTHCLIGTRALLGEGWDAQCVTGVIDLTSATTSTAIAQTRGRSLRTDPANPEKVSVNWTVTCVAPEHPDGDADYLRLVRKHQGWFAVDQEGEVVDGVAHLDARLSPSLVPDREEVADLNATARARARDLQAIREAWATVDASRNQPAAVLRVRGENLPWTREMAELAAPVSKPVVALLTVPWVAIGAAGAFIDPVVLIPSLVMAVVMMSLVAFDRTRYKRLRTAAAEPSLDAYARAVADTLQALDFSRRGADAVEVHTMPDGEVRVRMDGVSEDVSERFAGALDELIGPIESPRYLISRVHTEYAEKGLRSYLPWSGEDVEVWYQVPTLFGSSRSDADRFLRYWKKHVGDGRAVFVGSVEGRELITARRRSSPFGEDAALSTVHRRSW